MPLRDLAASLLESEWFRTRLRDVHIAAARAELPPRFGLLPLDAPEHDWGRLLLAASVLAKVEESDPIAGPAHDAALRIAQHCLVHTPEQTGLTRDTAPTDAQRASAGTILSSLANLPALRLATSRNLLPADLADRLPVVARMEWLRRDIENTVLLADDRELHVNHFQRRLWQELEAHEWVSFSAPTSAGKSYVLTHWLADLLRTSPAANLVYLVPTRALIGEVERELKTLLKGPEFSHVTVASLPLARALGSAANVLVFTQERLHILLTARPYLRIDALIVDEAHKIGDGHRGVLLQQVIEQVTNSSPEARILFASPMTANPELLIADAPEDVSATAITSNEITVAQNLFWVSQAPRDPTRWAVSLCAGEDIVEVSEIQLQATPNTTTKRLSYVAHAIGEGRGGNVLYVNTPSNAETVALQLYDLRGSAADATDDLAIAELIDLCRRTVHPRFLLTTTLRRGVAFHYGNLPLLIRTEIERLFSEGSIQYLVCTSTLIEGVNLSCRSVYVRGPRKGRSRPMNAEDFWNLAGRAGRWGKEFQGNIVCVDAADRRVWDNGGPPRSRARYNISRTADTVVSAPDDLVEFIAAGTPRSAAAKRPDLEFVFSYLSAQYLRHGSIRDLPWMRRIPSASVDRVADAVATALADLQTPLWVVERNPGVSPLAMDALLMRFARQGRVHDELIPVDPASNDAVEVYRAIFGRIAAELNSALGPAGGRSHALAILVTRWMNGQPLHRLITDRIAYEDKRDSKRSVGRIIRDVLADVEQIARFEAPRSLGCYIDLLRIHLQQVGRADLIEAIPDEVHVMLELGVSRPSQISMIALGLSRTSAVLLSELITQDDLNEAGVLEWLRGELWEAADLPELVKAEINRLLEEL